MRLPQIVYLQTVTQCNGHCRYCPFDDVYEGRSVQEMSLEDYLSILEWLKENEYSGRLGFLLHYEPTLDERLPDFIKHARDILPGVRLETATNGLIDSEALGLFDHVKCVAANSLTEGNSRAGNVRTCPEIMSRKRLEPPPCPVPDVSMCIAANGDVLLCCQDWRHEAVVGTIKDLTAARTKQIEYWGKAKRLELEICRDCMAGKTAEEVGDRLGKRFIDGRTEEDEPEKKTRKKKIATEAKSFKGGVNEYPSIDPPEDEPKGQGGNNEDPDNS